MIASSISDSRSNPSRAIVEGPGRVAVPQRDLGPERVQVGHELGIDDAARLAPRDLEVAAGGRQVAGPDGQMGLGHVRWIVLMPGRRPGDVTSSSSAASG